MVLINKLSFLSGSQRITGRFLDALQNSVRFDGETRSDVTVPPTDQDEILWAVNQRDGLLDWEHNPETAIGSLAWGGRIIASDGVSFGPSETVLINDTYFIYIYEGKSLSIDKELIEFPTQLVRVTPGITQFIWVDVETLAGMSTVASPPNDSIPLAKITISPGGLITEYIDLRPSSNLIDFSDRVRVLMFAEDEQSSDYVASSWERILADTSDGSLYIDLPLNPADDTQVSIVDSEGYFHLYPVFLRPAPNGDNTTGVTINGISNDAFALTRRYGVYTLVYSSLKNGWYFIDSQERKNFVRGDFIQCGGLQAIATPAGGCIAGNVPVEYQGEIDPPIYVLQGSRCFLSFKDNSGLYSNPSLIDREGIKVVFKDPRCTSADHKEITGGFFGFSAEQVADRTTAADFLRNDFDAPGGILSALAPITQGDTDQMREFNLRVAYAIQFQFWSQIAQFESPLKAIVDAGVLERYFNVLQAASVTEITAELKLELADELSWLLP